MHIKYQDPILKFYSEICAHKEFIIRKWAVYNLPAMHQHYKDSQDDFGISFQDLYKQFSEDEEFEIRYTAASSLHEAFKLIDPDEDTTILRQVLLSYILDNSREI